MKTGLKTLKVLTEKVNSGVNLLELESGHIKRNLVFSKFMVSTNFVAPFAFCSVILWLLMFVHKQVLVWWIVHSLLYWGRPSGPGLPQFQGYSLEDWAPKIKGGQWEQAFLRASIKGLIQMDQHVISGSLQLPNESSVGAGAFNTKLKTFWVIHQTIEMHRWSVI